MSNRSSSFLLPPSSFLLPPSSFLLPPSLAGLAAALFVSTGCLKSDQEFGDLGPPDDTALEYFEPPECWMLEFGTGRDGIWPGDAGVAGYCYFSNEDPASVIEETYFQPQTYRVTKVELLGMGSSMDDGLDALIRQQPDSQADDADMFYHTDIKAIVATPEELPLWSVEWTDAAIELGTLDGCTPNCHYAFKAWVKDEVSHSEDECDLLAPVEICTTWEDTSARRRVPAASACTAGSGRFELMPYTGLDRNNDGYVSAAFKPVQKSGTGVLTGAAWITSATAVTAQGQTIRIVKTGSPFSFSASDDALEDASTVSTALSNQSVSFSWGSVPGSTTFLMDRVPASTSQALEVDLSWTCGTPAYGEVVTNPPGFKFTSGTFSCAAQWPQQIVVRPLLNSGPRRLRFELYGDSQRHVDIKLFDQGNVTDKFEFDLYAMHVTGRLISVGTNNAVVSLTAASVGSLNVCSTGNFTLFPE